MDLIERALLKAYDLHKGQFRKISNVPYFVHLLDVAKYLMYETSDAEIICAGLLHDVLEDTSYSEVELKKEFGERIYRLVKFCTEEGNNHDNSESVQKSSWKERKTKAINKISGADVDELLVFCADKVANLLSIREDLLLGVDVWSKFNGSRNDVVWYYKSVEAELEEKLANKRIFLIFKDLIKVFD